MRGHLQCRDTLAGNQGCPLKTGTTVSYSEFDMEVGYLTPGYYHILSLTWRWVV